MSGLQAEGQREILGKFKLNGMKKVAILFHCNREVKRGLWLQVLPGCPEILAAMSFCLLAPSIYLPLLCWLEGGMLAGSLEPATSPP